MGILTDAEVLKYYRDIRKEIVAIEDQFEQAGITGKPAPLGAVAYDKPGGTTNDRTAAAMQAMDGIEQRLYQRRAELEAITVRFHDIIEGMRFPLWRTVCYRYYALGETDEEVAEALVISPKAANRNRNEAINSLQ